MKVLIFDVSGRFAHFRKYYTNSSSLSYTAPPRTTIYGMIAGMMGLERDQYYELFTPDRAKIGIHILSPIRRIMQTVNYMKIEGPRDFIYPKNHTQIPFEILTGDHGVAYRIYFAHEQEEFLETFRERLTSGHYYFAPYLGAAAFQANVKYIDFVDADYCPVEEEIPVSSLVNVQAIVERSLDFISEPVSLYRENMPRYFDEGRILHETASYLFERNGKPLRMKVKEPVLCLREGQLTTYHTFL